MGFNTMGNKHCKYQTCTIQEYFNILENIKTKETKIVAKSLVKYLKKKELAA